jgi:hypothetical protein
LGEESGDDEVACYHKSDATVLVAESRKGCKGLECFGAGVVGVVCESEAGVDLNTKVFDYQ